MNGLLKSASDSIEPVARSRLRCGARSNPFLMMSERMRLFILHECENRNQFAYFAEPYLGDFFSCKLITICCSTGFRTESRLASTSSFPHWCQPDRG